MTTRITTENITDATIGTADLASSVPLNVQWQAVVTASTLTAVAGRGYFINTTSNTCTVTLPGSPNIGDTITIVDYASTFATNNVTLNPNGNKIEGATTNALLSTNDQTHTLVYTDTTQGWKIVNQDTAAGIQPTFVAATGGTVTESGDFKIHTFTGDGCFVVSTVGNPAGAPSTVSYLVVAGGAGGAAGQSAGGGAGGFRESKSGVDTYTASPLVGSTDITVTATTYPVTVGSGGAGRCFPSSNNGVNGSNSVFSTITSVGGGGGGQFNGGGAAGGSGGGGGGNGPGNPGGAGNTPPVTPPQGNAGGAGGQSDGGGGGGGGATASGGASNAPRDGGDGGAGATTSISASPTAYAGGGGGGAGAGAGRAGGTGGGGSGGGGNQPSNILAVAGTTNTGGGGGGGGNSPNDQAHGKSGGSGIVIIRYKFQ